MAVAPGFIFLRLAVDAFDGGGVNPRVAGQQALFLALFDGDDQHVSQFCALQRRCNVSSAHDTIASPGCCRSARRAQHQQFDGVRPATQLR
jgi:hypothetical protein